jgi:Na+/H+-dicarboxylate symporter
MNHAGATRSNGRLTTLIGIGLMLGIAVGVVLNRFAVDPAQAEHLASGFTIVTDIFLRLIKMIIAPLIFATIVSGIASFGNVKAVGGIAVRAMGWFVIASLVSLSLGMLFANLFQPGAGLDLPMPDATAETGLAAAELSFRDFITHVFPTSIVEAMAGNEVLQILVFSLFFGFAVAALPSEMSKPLIRLVDAVASAMFKVTDTVMKVAPFAVFAAIAAVVTVQGPGVLVDYGKFIGAFYLGLAALWTVLLLAGRSILGPSVWDLVRLLRSPMLLAFSTASSEAAFPKTIEKLDEYGVHERVTGFVLPLGYSFNLDGSMMYQTFAALFIAQAFGIEMSFAEQASMLLVMMIASKGIAGVPRASLVVVAAVAPMFNLPAAGILLIMGIDQILDMGRTVTNVLGNGLATAAVAKWHGEVDEAPEATAVLEAA